MFRAPQFKLNYLNDVITGITGIKLPVECKFCQVAIFRKPESTAILTRVHRKSSRRISPGVLQKFTPVITPCSL